MGTLSDDNVDSGGLDSLYSPSAFTAETVLTQKELELSCITGGDAEEGCMERGFCYKLPGGMQLLGMECSQGNCC